MKVVLSAGGRFHALHLAKELNQRNCLKKLFTFDYQDKDTRFIPASKVTSVTSCKIMNDWYLKLRLAKFFDKTKFNVFKDNLFDKQVSKHLAHIGPFDIFVGWAHYAENSIAAARRAGAKIIIESGSCHIKTQQTILLEEYNKWGIPFTPIKQETIEKMQKEYELADYIMTLSSCAQNSFFEHGFNKKKILKVPCGIDVEYFEHPSIQIAKRFTPDYVQVTSTDKQDERDSNKPLHSAMSEPDTKQNKLIIDQTATNSAHPECFAPVRRSSLSVGEKQNVSKDSSDSKFRVIFVGLITLRKGLQYLIQAWQQANLPEIDTELIIVGAMQKDFAQIMPQLPIKNNITFVGSTNRETLKRLYHSSSLFVLPSLEDGFGMVIGEAMASGLPVICTTSSAGPDIITNQDCGFLVKPHDVNALAEKITWCYENKEEAAFMGQQGNNRIKEFSWDHYGKTIHQTYSQILEIKKHG